MQLKTLTIFVLLALLMSDASAQVSVRRRSSSSSRTQTEKQEKKVENKQKEEKSKKVTDAVALPRQASDKEVEEGRPAPELPKIDPGDRKIGPEARETVSQRTVPTKRTTPKKTGTQPSAMAEGMTLRQQAFAEYQRQEPQYVPWQHVVYRELDMNVGENASLYYPIEPQDGMTNLFRVILDALCKGELKAYEYMDGREVFSEKYQLNVESMLQKFEIPYQPQASAGRTIYRVEEVDVPSNEVMSYYLKERWQYDLNGSRYSAQVLAICPILHRIGEFGDAVPYPMCWINFEDLRPFLRGHLIMLDGMNNAPRLTMEEYFTLNKYKGELYKVQNTRGLNLMQQYPDSASLAEAREQIDAQLRGFKDSIWVHEPTAEEIAVQDSIAAAKRIEKRAARKNKAPRTDKGEKLNRRTKEVVDLEAVEESETKAHSARRTR